MFYPTIAPFRLVKFIDKMTSKNFTKIPFEFIKQDGAYIAGYAVLIETELHPLMLLEKTGWIMKEFSAKTKSKSDEVVVYIDGVPKDNDLYGFGKYYDFKTRVLKESSRAFFYRPGKLADIETELKRISREQGKIGRLEILGHGVSGSSD